METNGLYGWKEFKELEELNSMPELQKCIDMVFDFLLPEYAIHYCQGFIDGIKIASHCERLTTVKWLELNKYIKSKYKKMSNQSDTNFNKKDEE